MRTIRFLLVTASALALSATSIVADEVVLDSQGRLAKILHADGSQTRMTYDLEGRLILVEKPDGSRVCTSYENGVEDTFEC